MKEEKQAKTTRLPQAITNNPIFASCKQKDSRQVIVNNQKWTIGVANPTMNKKFTNKFVYPALDINHAVIIGILMRKFELGITNAKVNFSQYEIAKIFYNTDNLGGGNYEFIQKLINDLENTYITIDEEKDGVITKRTFNVLKNTEFNETKPTKKRMEIEKSTPNLINFDYVEFSQGWLRYIEAYSKLQGVNLSCLIAIQNHIAQATYLFLAARACYATKNNPAKITISNLLTQLGESVPKSKNGRKQKFIRKDKNKNVIDDLDVIPLYNGQIMRCELKPTKDKKDFNLIVWSEGDAVLKEPTKAIYKAFKKGKLRRNPNLTDKNIISEYNLRLKHLDKFKFEDWIIERMEEPADFINNKTMKIYCLLLDNWLFCELLSELTVLDKKGRNMNLMNSKCLKQLKGRVSEEENEQEKIREIIQDSLF